MIIDNKMDEKHQVPSKIIKICEIHADKYFVHIVHNVNFHNDSAIMHIMNNMDKIFVHMDSANFGEIW